MGDMDQAYKVSQKLASKASRIALMFVYWQREKTEKLTLEEHNKFADMMNELQSMVNELRRRVGE